MNGRHDLRFGVITDQSIPFAELRDDWLFVESLGIDNLWLGDHISLPRMPQRPYLECWATLAALAESTSRVRIGPFFANVATRNPVLHARQATTVDGISGGRLDLGLSAGYYEEEFTWAGIDFPDAAGRRRRFGEAVEIIDGVTRGEPVRFSGEFFTAHEPPAHTGPQFPRPPLWLAAYEPDYLPVIAARVDVVAFFGRQGTSAHTARQRLLDGMAEVNETLTEAGRDPATVRRCYLSGNADERIFESDDSLADFVGRTAEAGVTDFVFHLFNPVEPLNLAAVGRWADRAALERAAMNVFPKLRGTQPSSR